MDSPTRDELLDLAVKQAMTICERNAEIAELRETVFKLKHRIGQLEGSVVSAPSPSYLASQLDWINKLVAIDRQAVEQSRKEVEERAQAYCNKLALDRKLSEEEIKERAKAYSVRLPHAINNAYKKE